MTYKNPNYQKEYREKHKNHLKEQWRIHHKKYYEEHKEKVKEKSRINNKKRYVEKGEYIREKSKKNYHIRKEYIKEYKRLLNSRNFIKNKKLKIFNFKSNEFYIKFWIKSRTNVKTVKREQRNAKQKEYNRIHDEQRKRYREEHPEIYRRNWLKRNFNITLEDYNKLFEKQNGCCAICGKHQNEFEKNLSVDHDHFMDEIRGLLCSNCNLILGNSKDNPYILRKAAEYLENQFV